MRKKNIILLFLIASFFLYNGCNGSGKVASLKEEKLFTLHYGMFENELRISDTYSQGFTESSIFMEDGMFYIEDSISKKIMILSSYGDLVQILYNKESNPVPSFVSKQTSDISNENAEIVTQKAVEYPFTNLGAITADRQKNLYVVDYLPPERYKEKNSVFLRQVVLRFKADGTFIDYLGQEGPGGTPFPYIENLYTTSNNELVIVCRTLTGFCVYWYTTEGFLKYTIALDTDKLPQLKIDENIEQYVVLSQIIPDNNDEKLYLQIDYQVSARDSSSNVQSGIEFKETALYPLEVATGKYGSPLIIPPFEETETNGYTKTIHKLAYDFLGVTDSGWFFFTIGDPTGYSILMVQPNGQRVISKHINIDQQQILSQPFCLSRKGIISAMLVTNKEANICWWRTDNIIASFLK
jgi:hypothetical protein